jgi:excisionase family DNA binding protein
VNNSNSVENLPIFLSITDTYKILNISQSSILRYVKDGKIAHVKLGRRTLIPREAIEDLLRKSFENCKNDNWRLNTLMEEK